MRRLAIIMVFLCLMVITPSPVEAVPSDATQTALISIEVYWAITAGGFGDWPEENEWNVLYEGVDLNFDFKDFYLYFKVNATVLISFLKWVEVSIMIECPPYGGISSSNASNQAQDIGGFQTEHWAEADNIATATVCVNTTEGDYYYNRRTFTINFPITSTTIMTETTIITTPISTTTPTTTDNDPTMNTSLQLLAVIGIVIAIAYTAIVISRRRTSPTSLDARVLIVCPYCGARNEQGILQCQKCKADL